MFPSDLRPRRAVKALQGWLSEGNSGPDFEALCHAAEQSHIDMDYLTEDVDPALCAAMEAASACSHAALAVKSVLDDEPHEKLCRITAWIARFGVKSAPDRQAEAEWQTRRLVALLLE